MGGRLFRGLAYLALGALVFVASCQAWWVGGAPAVGAEATRPFAEAPAR